MGREIIFVLRSFPCTCGFFGGPAMRTWSANVASAVIRCSCGVSACEKWLQKCNSVKYTRNYTSVSNVGKRGTACIIFKNLEILKVRFENTSSKLSTKLFIDVEFSSERLFSKKNKHHWTLKKTWKERLSYIVLIWNYSTQKWKEPHTSNGRKKLLKLL